jgi:hypothetical protein
MPEPDMNALLSEIATSDQNVAAQALVRFQSSESYQARQVQRIQDLHHYYHPNMGDQWPGDKAKRPGKVHVTVNLVKAAVDVDSRLQSILPRMTIPVETLSPKDRQRAEGAEAMLLQYLELSGVDVWLHTACQTKSLYGKAILRPFWDDDLERPDVTVIENPAALRLGYGDSDYTRYDWSIYEYGISLMEAQQRWPNVDFHASPDPQGPPMIRVHGTDHTDPLDQRVDDFFKPRHREYSEYEKGQLKVWDYWYRGKDDMMMNAILANGVIVEGPNEHPHIPDIPYIVIENDHEPGNPEGVSTVEPILDIQEEFNRLVSHGLQHVADDVDPSWFLTVPSADAVPPGLIPKAGKVVGAGENDIRLIPKGVNTFPISEMLAELWKQFHRLTGLPEILFGQTPGADTSGRAIAIQVEAAANRLDPRRRRLYRGLKELLIFWSIMVEKKDPKINLGPDEEGVEQEASIGELVKGFKTWKIVAPEITPRDNFEITNNELAKVQGKLTSMRSAMDAIGTEAPEAELDIIRSEQGDIDLNPGSVQAKVSIYPILQQVLATQQQMGQQLDQLTAGPPGSVLQQGAQGANAAAQQLQAQGPAAPTEDQNLPATGPNGPPPPGAPGPGGPTQNQTTLIRDGKALNQIATNTPLG